MTPAKAACYILHFQSVYVAQTRFPKTLNMFLFCISVFIQIQYKSAWHTWTKLKFSHKAIQMISNLELWSLTQMHKVSLEWCFAVYHHHRFSPEHSPVVLSHSTAGTTAPAIWSACLLLASAVTHSCPLKCHSAAWWALWLRSSKRTLAS